MQVNQYELLSETVEEFAGITTVGEIKKCLSTVDDDQPVTDVMGNPIMISVYRGEGSQTRLEVQ